MPICPHCGAEIPDGDRFCTNCGAPLSADTPTPKPPPASETPSAPQTPPAPETSSYASETPTASGTPATSGTPTPPPQPPYPGTPFGAPNGAPPPTSGGGLLTAIKVFAILACALLPALFLFKAAIDAALGYPVTTLTFTAYLLPLAWKIPLAVSLIRDLRRGMPIGVGRKVVALLFISPITGILLFCLPPDYMTRYPTSW